MKLLRLNKFKFLRNRGILALTICSTFLSLINLYDFLAVKLCSYVIRLNFATMYLIVVDLVGIALPLFFTWKILKKRQWARFTYLALSFLFVSTPLAIVLIFYVFSDNQLKIIPIIPAITLGLYFVIFLSFTFKSSREWFKQVP